LILVIYIHWLLWLFSLGPKKDLRGERLANQKWLLYKEIPRYIKFCSLLFDMKMIDPKGICNFNQFIRQMMKIWKFSGVTFFISYYTEVLRLVICYVDKHNRFYPNTKVWVKIHKGRRSNINSLAGLPVSLPQWFKDKCRSVKIGITSGSLTRRDLILFKLGVSVLSIFRCTSPKWSQWKVDTITAPLLEGACSTLPEKQIRFALKSMGLLKGKKIFKSSPNIFQFSVKAGPNAPLAVLGIGLDLIGMMHNWNCYKGYCLMAYSRGYFLLLNVFLLCSLLILPVAILFYFINWKPLIGRIAVIAEARGKNRLIGITDWWTQVLFKPLHDDIYAFLGTLTQDGTNDQSGPIKALLKSLGVKCTFKAGKRLQSMDLSAATDRLPIDLQVQVLEILGYEGKLWKQVLDREWWYHGQLIRYSVGQPMGAYSSFAMLALTHHVIMRISFWRSNPGRYEKINKFSYAVLGDDGAMADRKASEHYKFIFKSLGMEINPVKGFDGTVLEFAKQLWSVTKYNLTPLGAKNILLFIRNAEYLPSILYELIVKGFPIFHNLHTKMSIWDKGKYSSNRNYKRTFDSVTVIPFISVKTLVNMCSSLFYRKVSYNKILKKFETKKYDDRVWTNILTKVRLIVLMSIGPRSGLWYTSPKISSYIFNSLYENFWRRQFITALGIFGFVDLMKTNPVLWVKNEDESRIHIYKGFKKSLLEVIKLLKIYLNIPFTFVPDFSKDSRRFHPKANVVFWYTALSSPTPFVLIVSLLKEIVKITLRSLMLIRMEIIKVLNRSRLPQNLDLWPLLSLLVAFVLMWFVIGILWVLTLYVKIDFEINDVFIFIILFSHALVSYVRWFYQINPGEYNTEWLRNRTDLIDRAFDPYHANISMLEKIADKHKLEDTGAWKQIIRMTFSSRRVQDLLLRNANLLKEGQRAILLRRFRKDLYKITTNINSIKKELFKNKDYRKFKRPPVP